MRTKKILYISFVFMIALTLCSCGVLIGKTQESVSAEASIEPVEEETAVPIPTENDSEKEEKSEKTESNEKDEAAQEEPEVVSATVKVPDVEGRPQDEGISILEALDFEALIVEKKSDTVEKGFIISQAPTGGKNADYGSSVTIYVSTGNGKKKSSDANSAETTVTPVPTAAPTATPTPQPVYTGRDRSYATVYLPPEDINVRVQPGYTSARVGTLGAGTTLYFYGEIGQGYGSDGVLHDWYFIETDQGINGYVRSDLIYALSAQPSEPSQPSYPTVYTDKYINLRAEPKHESGLVTTVTGTLYYLGETGYGYGSDGEPHEWSKVMTPDGTIGWARRDLLSW